MALLCAAAVATTLFAGCGSTGAEQTGNDAGSTVTEAAQGKDSAGGGNAAQSVAGTADTVIVVMSPSSEPAAGFNPCINWGCGEHCHGKPFLPFYRSDVILPIVSVLHSWHVVRLYNR